MGPPRQEYWNMLPFPPPGDLPDPRIETVSLASPVLQVDFLPPGKPYILIDVSELPTPQRKVIPIDIPTIRTAVSLSLLSIR